MHSQNPAKRLVGRTHEENTLQNLLQRARQSHGQAVLLVGEPGIGKTHLLTTLSDSAESSEMMVLRGECMEHDQDFPYAPVIDGLRTYFSGISSDEVQRIIDPFQSELIQLLPELALRIEAPPTPAPLEPRAEKRRLFEVLVQIYQRLAPSGLLLIFEDVHWCDANSLEFFQTLTRRISNLPIMVAISSRFTSPDSDVAKLQLYFDRTDNAQSITLNPLPDTEIENLIKIVLQTTDRLHPALLESLNSLVQGNPLYTEQLLYMLLQNRRINLVNGTWIITSPTNTVKIPTTVTQIIEQQIERLSESAQRIIKFAAVAGQQFEWDVLQQLTEIDETQLMDSVKELVNKRFFEELSQDRFAFRHALLRQAIYDGLLIRERQALHQSLLHILQRRMFTQPDTHYTALSYHAYQAQAWEAALQYGLQAGQHALSFHSPRAAVEHFNHAIEAAKRLKHPASWELLMERGKAFDNLGEFQSALDDYEAALNIAETNDDQDFIWQTLIVIALLWSSRDYQRAGTYCKRALQLAQSMEDPDRIGHSLNRLGNWYLNTGQPHVALDYHQQALAVFDELDDLQGKGETLDLLGMTSGHVLHLDAQLDYYRRAVDIFRELGAPKAQASTLANLAQCTYDYRYAEEAIDISRQIGWYSGEAYACITAAFTHSAYGHFTQSLTYIRRGLELVRAIDHSQWLAAIQIYSGFTYRELLELETAASGVKQGVELAKAIGSHWFDVMGTGLLAQIYIDLGRFDAAAECLAQHEIPNEPAMQHLSMMMSEIELVLARGDAGAALALNTRLQQVTPIGETSSPISSFSTVPYFMIQAKALAMLDRHAEALEMIQHARQICVDQKLLPQQWRVEVVLGQIISHQDEALAQESFQRAHAIVHQLAENVPKDLRGRFIQNAEKHIASGQHTGKSADQHSGATQFELTPREMDVVKEVAAGKTNQQIADTLHITVKTVETHLTRVLSKLDMTSRTQVALWAAENHLTPPPE